MAPSPPPPDDPDAVLKPNGDGRVLDVPHRRDTAASGQVMEFLVWANLIDQSGGALHVFLPLLDRGLDAVIHRLTDGEYIPVQVKSRTEAVNGFVEIGIPASSLVDDRALIIAGLLAKTELGPKLLVIDQAKFKGLASRSPVRGEDVYSASFTMDPSSRSHWGPYLVPRDRLAERLLGPALPLPSFELPVDSELELVDDHSRWLGFLGEMEVIRWLAFNLNLSIFRPFPDSEMVEVLVRNDVIGRFLGLQVKTGVPAPPYGEARIAIRKATLVPAASTYLVALAWLAEQKHFADECLLVPSTRITEIAVEDTDHWVLNFHPRSQERGPLDPYRRRLSTLGELAEGLFSCDEG